ncbi:hypothetical protein M426DRAFT_26683 [Hypoxylon sp. CI-4A]|nr:hypothetical protein M426DRAFT_26683 [Hypoxylon sp. CI-4A]
MSSPYANNNMSTNSPFNSPWSSSHNPFDNRDYSKTTHGSSTLTDNKKDIHDIQTGNNKGGAGVGVGAGFTGIGGDSKGADGRGGSAHNDHSSANAGVNFG